MNELSEIEFEHIVQCIRSSIRDPQLQTELIDHCCCRVEELMFDGLVFSEALNRALSMLSPEGIHELEVELNQLLTPQIPKTMKISLYFSGFLAAFCLMLGLMMRIQHWPGADMFLLCGDVALIASMSVLLVAIFRFPASFGGLVLVRSLAGAGGGLILGVGATFKLMHWPMASILMVIGMSIITFVFVPLFFWQLYKREMA